MNNVIIIGGGIAGLCAAISLQKIGIEVKVYDKTMSLLLLVQVLSLPQTQCKHLNYTAFLRKSKIGNESDGFNLVSEKVLLSIS